MSWVRAESVVWGSESEERRESEAADQGPQEVGREEGPLEWAGERSGWLRVEDWHGPPVGVTGETWVRRGPDVGLAPPNSTCATCTCCELY